VAYLRVALAIALCLVTSLAHAAGFQLIEIPPTGSRQALKGAVWYPCNRPTSDLNLGPFTLSVSKDCPVTGNKLPLVVFSHGRGGTFLGHHDTAETLADAGFLVVAINHPGDTALDKSRTDEISTFIERPADIGRAIDFMLGPWAGAARIDAGRIGFFGFSRGGYTGLVAIGANPSFGRRIKACDGKTTPICEQIHKGELPELAHDPRIKAAVIADPLSIFFTEESFKTVRVPIQLWESEHGGDGVTPDSVANIVNELPTKPDFHLVPNARHFAFLAPCSAELAETAPEICTDGPDFDRIAFHKMFNATVLAFFHDHLGRE
jgi:predicted dienelactone hydrolase